MNEFVAKKLGEVHAFSNIGKECADRGGDSFVEALGEVEGFTTKLNEFAEAAASKGNEVTVAKSEKTTEKLRGMMEAYIGDEWDNPVELLEWLSFFLGSASAHWSLVAGAATGIADDELHATAQEAVQFYKNNLEVVIEKLNQVGQQRAAA